MEGGGRVGDSQLTGILELAPQGLLSCHLVGSWRRRWAGSVCSQPQPFARCHSTHRWTQPARGQGRGLPPSASACRALPPAIAGRGAHCAMTPCTPVPTVVPLAHLTQPSDGGFFSRDDHSTKLGDTHPCPLKSWQGLPITTHPCHAPHPSSRSHSLSSHPSMTPPLYLPAFPRPHPHHYPAWCPGPWAFLRR